MKKTIYLLALVTLLFTGLQAADNLVPVNDPIYPFLNRLENMGIIKGFQNGAIPLKRSEVAVHLSEAALNAGILNQRDQDYLNEFYVDYRRELTEYKHHNLSEEENLFCPLLRKGCLTTAVKNTFKRDDVTEETHLFIYEDDEVQAWADVQFTLFGQTKNGHYRSVISDKYMFSSQLGSHVSMDIEFSRYIRQNNPDYQDKLDIEQGLWNMQQPGGEFTSDIVHANIAYHQKYFDLGLYNQPIKWGRSTNNNLVLSAYGQAFPYIGFTGKYKTVKLTFIHGNLLHDSTHVQSHTTEERNRSKYIAAHYLDFSLFKNKLKIGFADIVIYGDRNIETSYLVPVNFFWSAGHMLKDRDNSLIAFDAELHVIKNTRIYGALFLDEMRFSELGNHWWANKQALQGGIEWSTAVAGIPVDFLSECTVVRPWLYTHKTLTTNYTHSGVCLGFPYGPNSQLFMLSADIRPNRRLGLNLSWNYLKHGEDEAGKYWGGTVTSYYLWKDPAYDHETYWLMGPVKTTNWLTFTCKYEVFNNSFIHLKSKFQHIDFEDNTTKDIFLEAGVSVKF